MATTAAEDRTGVISTARRARLPWRPTAPSTAAPAADADPGERHVFVAEDRWRHRAVGVGIALAAVLLIGWLAAIIAGALGFGSLPGLPLVNGARGGTAPAVSVPRRAAVAQAAGVGLRRRALQPAHAAARAGAASVGIPSGRRQAAARPSPATGPAAHGLGGHASATGALSPSANPAHPAATAPTAPARGGASNTGSSTAAGGGSAHAAEGHRAPSVTPSGHEVASGSAPAPSSTSEAAKEGRVGTERRATKTSG